MDTWIYVCSLLLIPRVNYIKFILHCDGQTVKHIYYERNANQHNEIDCWLVGWLADCVSYIHIYMHYHYWLLLLLIVSSRQHHDGVPLRAPWDRIINHSNAFFIHFGIVNHLPAWIFMAENGRTDWLAVRLVLIFPTAGTGAAVVCYLHSLTYDMSFSRIIC